MNVAAGATQDTWIGDPITGPATELTVEQALGLIPRTDADYTCAGVVLPDNRVAVVMVLDDRGGLPADTGNVNGSTVAGAVRAAYNAAKGV